MHLIRPLSDSQLNCVCVRTARSCDRTATTLVTLNVVRRHELILGCYRPVHANKIAENTVHIVELEMQTRLLRYYIKTLYASSHIHRTARRHGHVLIRLFNNCLACGVKLYNSTQVRVEINHAANKVAENRKYVWRLHCSQFLNSHHLLFQA